MAPVLQTNSHLTLYCTRYPLRARRAACTARSGEFGQQHQLLLLKGMWHPCKASHMLYYSMYGLNSHRQRLEMPRKKVMKKAPGRLARGPLAASGPPPTTTLSRVHHFSFPASYILLYTYTITGQSLRAKSNMVSKTLGAAPPLV
jgi:hypothetical protein